MNWIQNKIADWMGIHNRSGVTIENIDGIQHFFYEIWNNGKRETTRYKDDAQRINAVINNPAALRVWKINCDLFSLGKINQYQENKETEKDFLYGIKKRPNFYQTWTQFFWDYMFWLQCGTAYMYRTSNTLRDNTSIYWLNPANIDWGKNGRKKYSKFVTSRLTYNEQQRDFITYNWPGTNQTETIYLKDITPFFDLSNGLSENYYEGLSDIDALYKVLKNSELALDSKGINLEFSQKFLVVGQADPGDVSANGIGMSEPEKKNIEQKMRSNRKVHAIKSKISINRFVENMAHLKLDDSFYNDYFTIGAMKGVPRDLLELSLKGSTYENQEKSIGRHVEYGMKPKGQMLTDEFESIFDFQDLRMSWDHLSFNQVFEKDKAERQKIQLENLEIAQRMGMDAAELARQSALIMTM